MAIVAPTPSASNSSSSSNFFEKLDGFHMNASCLIKRLLKSKNLPLHRNAPLFKRKADPFSLCGGCTVTGCRYSVRSQSSICLMYRVSWVG